MDTQIQSKLIKCLYLVYFIISLFVLFVTYFTDAMLIYSAILEAKLLGLNHIVIYTTVN